MKASADNTDTPVASNDTITQPPVDGSTQLGDPVARLVAAAEAAAAEARGNNSTKPRDISRQQAAKIIVGVFGELGFARKKTKTSPGMRRQVAMRSALHPNQVKVIGAGRTWLEALKAAADEMDNRQRLGLAQP